MVSIAKTAGQFLFEWFIRLALRIAVTAPDQKPAVKSIPEKPPNKEDDYDLTLASFLEGIDGAWETMRVPDAKDSWAPKHEIKAVRKVGIYVPHPWLFRHQSVPHLETRGLPIIATAAFPGVWKRQLPSEDSVCPTFIFAHKQPNRVSPLLEQVKDTLAAYSFGFTVSLPPKDNPTGPDENLWFYCFVVVRKDRTIYLPRELRTSTQYITLKNNRGDAGRVRSFQRRTWNEPSLAHLMTELPWTLEERERWLCSEFSNLIDWWNRRNDRWSVAVRKEGQRVTFSVDQGSTASFFKDRDKSVTANGKTRKIIHYVRPHDRQVGEKLVPVREHVRGEREFNWRGYHCCVTAPGLNGQVVTALFDLPPLEPNDRPDGKTSVSVDRVVGRLVEMEESHPDSKAWKKTRTPTRWAEGSR